MNEQSFKPQSIAVIGASNKRKKLGFQVLKNIIDGGYKGRIYPINIEQKTKKILGLKSYTSVMCVKGGIDMAVFLIPAGAVNDALEECGKKKIKTAVIISAGFKEIGGEGAEREKALLKIAKKYRIRVLGPNCLGYIDTEISLNASFAPEMPKKGSVAVISQSGAICTAILDWANQGNIGFSKFFSLGNKSDITELDLLPYLTRDKQTDVIVSYLENVSGDSHGNDFRKISQKTTMKKPLIILKAGTGKKAQEAISSHTGSLAGSNQVISALFKQSGVIRAESLQDLFDYTEAFSSLKLPGGKRVAIITNAGGPGVMTTDAVENTRLELATLEEETTKKLKKYLPSTANVHNPIDVIGDANADRYKKALDIIEKDPGVDSILVLLTPQTSTQIKDTARIILKKIKSSEKTIVPVFMGGRRANKGIEIFEKSNTGAFEYPERAVRVLEKISFCQNCGMGLKKIYKPRVLNIKRKDKDGVTRIIKKSQSNLIAGPVADNLLHYYNIPTIKSRLIKNKIQAIKEGRKLGFPLVIKIDSPDIMHKSDVGGVVVGIKKERELAIAYDKIIKNAKKSVPKARINGVILYEMISGGTEFFVGAKRDPLYGPLIGFGLGGIYVEILKDVSFRLAPLGEFDIEKMLSELKSSKIISGTRGKKALYKKGIIDTLIKVSNLMINHPEIKELDINPLMVLEDKVVALDNRIIIH